MDIAFAFVLFVGLFTICWYFGKFLGFAWDWVVDKGLDKGLIIMEMAREKLNR